MRPFDDTFQKKNLGLSVTELASLPASVLPREARPAETALLGESQRKNLISILKC